MKTGHSKRNYRAAMLLLSTVLSSQVILSQTTDTTSSTSCGAVQFQLVGGLGVYFLGEYDKVCHYRIGVDLNYSHSDQSGDGSGYDIYSSSSSSSGSSLKSQPDQKSTSYQITLSGLFIQQLIEYKHALLYCGVGPMASYAWDTRSNKSQLTQTNIPSLSTTSSTNVQGSSSKTSGIGPLAIVGVRSQLLEHVGLSAEIAVSAVYQWTTLSDLYSDSSVYSPSMSTNSTKEGSVAHTHGWPVGVSGIRVGLIMEL